MAIYGNNVVESFSFQDLGISGGTIYRENVTETFGLESETNKSYYERDASDSFSIGDIGTHNILEEDSSEWIALNETGIQNYFEEDSSESLNISSQGSHNYIDLFIAEALEITNSGDGPGTYNIDVSNKIGAFSGGKGGFLYSEVLSESLSLSTSDDVFLNNWDTCKGIPKPKWSAQSLTKGTPGECDE